MAPVDTAAGLRRLALIALAAGTAIAGVAAVIALLSGSFGAADGRVIAASLGFGIFSATASTGAVLRLRTEAWARILGAATIASSVLAFALLLWVLPPDSSDTTARAWLLAVVAALWTAHASVVLGSGRASDGTLVRTLSGVAVGALTVDAVAAVLLITQVVHRHDVERLDRVLGAVLVVAVVASALLPILRRLAGTSRDPQAPSEAGDSCIDAAAARLAAVATTPQLQADLALLRGSARGGTPPVGRPRAPLALIGALVLVVGATLALAITDGAGRHAIGDARVVPATTRPPRQAPPPNFTNGPSVTTQGIAAPEPSLRRSERQIVDAVRGIDGRTAPRATATCRTTSDGVVPCDVLARRGNGTFSRFTQIGHYDPHTDLVMGLLRGLRGAMTATARTPGQAASGPRGLLEAVRPIVESCFTDTRDYTQCMRLSQLERFGAAKLPVSDGDPQPGQAGMIAATTTSYALMALTGPGASFTLARRPGGRIVRTCEPSGSPGCGERGTW